MAPIGHLINNWQVCFRARAKRSQAWTGVAKPFALTGLAKKLAITPDY
jgi:hypothetical protein